LRDLSKSELSRHRIAVEHRAQDVEMGVALLPCANQIGPARHRAAAAQARQFCFGGSERFVGGRKRIAESLDLALADPGGVDEFGDSGGIGQW